MECLFYPFKIHLYAPLILGAHSGDPNSSETLFAIPGNTFRGAIARAVESRFSADSQKMNQLIEDLVLEPQIAFLPAYPVVENSRGLPIPFSVRKDKYSDNYYDLLAYTWAMGDSQEDQENVWPECQVKECRQFFNAGSATTCYGIPTVSARIHNQRDRQKGRAWKSGDISHGSIFSYEYLDEGQTFAGVIKISGTTKEKIKKRFELIKELIGEKIFFGRSKRAGYGGDGTLTWEEPQEREVKNTSGRFAILEADIQSGSLFRVLATSPYIGRDPETGNVDPHYAGEELEKAFGKKAILKKSCGSIGIIGGFNRKWGCEIPQARVLNAGSVFLLEALDTLTVNDWKEVEKHGIGSRKNEGFGSIIFLSSPLQVVNPERPAEKDIKAPALNPPDEIRKLEKKLVMGELFRQLDKKVYNELQSIANTPPGHLLGRFRNLLRSQPDSALQNISVWLGDDPRRCLKRQAMKHLMKCRIENHSLLEILRDLAESDRLFDTALLNPLKNLLICTREAEFGKGFFADCLNQVKMRYLESLLHGMSLKNRLGVKSNG